MKNKFLKASLITALNLSAAVGWGQASPHLTPTPSRETICAHQTSPSFSHFLSMQTNENLKAYHVGLRHIFLNYRAPSAQVLLHTIRSHPQFIGPLSQKEARARFEGKSRSHLIFEDKDCPPGHFYLAHFKGIRHFTVGEEENVAGINNAHAIRYPGLAQILRSATPT